MRLLKRPAGVFLILCILFLVPLIAAWWMAQHKITWTGKTTQHGQLLTPPRALAELVTTQVGQGHWLLLYVSPNPCDAVCAKRLFFLKQIHTATGKNQARVRTAVLKFSDQKKDPALQNILAQLPDLWPITAPPTAPAKLALQQGYIYLSGSCRQYIYVL